MKSPAHSRSREPPTSQIRQRFAADLDLRHDRGHGQARVIDRPELRIVEEQSRQYIGLVGRAFYRGLEQRPEVDQTRWRWRKGIAVASMVMY